MTPDLVPPPSPPGESTTTNSVLPAEAPAPEVVHPAFADLLKRVEDLEDDLDQLWKKVVHHTTVTSDLANGALSKEAASRIREDLFGNGR